MDQTYPVYVKMPGSIFSPNSQVLRDDIFTWMKECGLESDRDYTSYYTEHPGSYDVIGESGVSHANQCRYICFSFLDPKMGMMFKLAFG